MFIEVTSSVSVNECRTAMQELLREMLMANFGASSTEEHRSLIVQQVKITDPEGNLRSVYPSKTDLQFEGQAISVQRE